MPKITVDLTSEQRSVHDQIIDFFKSGDKVMTVGGYAGTGKTTLISKVVESLEKEDAVVAFCCYTGKAASVLREKLDRAGISPEFCGTIHSLIYRPIIVDGRVDGWELKQFLSMDDNEELAPDLIVVDEASMVSADIWNDLQSFEIPILAVGDHGQLPPISGSLNLMQNPDATLTKIHRQAENNPIIKLSMMAREGIAIPFGAFGPGVMKIQSNPRKYVSGMENAQDVPLFLCGYNWTRVNVNKMIRARLGRKFFPEIGDRVVCLKNNRRAGIFNGMSGEILRIDRGDKFTLRANIIMDDGSIYTGHILKQQFCAVETYREHDEVDLRDVDLFDFGYCLTVHKAQGSEAPEVVIFEERFKSATDDGWQRWLYTAITRARERLTIVGKGEVR